MYLLFLLKLLSSQPITFSITLLFATVFKLKKKNTDFMFVYVCRNAKENVQH